MIMQMVSRKRKYQHLSGQSCASAATLDLRMKLFESIRASHATPPKSLESDVASD
jgi:hypothetical protein